MYNDKIYTSSLNMIKIFYLQKCQNRETVHNIQKFCLDKQIKIFWNSQSDFRKISGNLGLGQGSIFRPKPAPGYNIGMLIKRKFVFKIVNPSS